MYSCHYPIYQTFTADQYTVVDYNITVNNNVIYSGRVSQNDPSGTIQIDISEVCRQYLYTAYEKQIYSLTAYTFEGIEGTIATFVLNSDYGTGSYQVGYNYNTIYQPETYVTDLLNFTRINYPISLDIDPRQRFGMTAYNVTAQTNISFNGTSYSLNTRLYNNFSMNLRPLNLPEGYQLRTQASGITYFHNVVKPCKNKYVLQYVNKGGGLDYLLFTGKVLDKWTVDRTQIKTYDNRNSRRDFQKVNICQKIDKRYTLTTGMLTDEGAANIDHLIYSPKVWIEDLETNTITSVMITDVDYTIKNFKNDRRVIYTVNCVESQEYLRK
jgi:hypothetical protein